MSKESPSKEERPKWWSLLSALYLHGTQSHRSDALGKPGESRGRKAVSLQPEDPAMTVRLPSAIVGDACPCRILCLATGVFD